MPAGFSLDPHYVSLLFVLLDSDGVVGSLSDSRSSIVGFV